MYHEHELKIDPLAPQDTSFHSPGVDAIAAERRRQVDGEGWTPEHDAQYVYGELCYLAACYARVAMFQEQDNADGYFPRSNEFERLAFEGGNWPQTLDRAAWNPSQDPKRNLEKAGALIAAAIDRMDREE